jgi:hypothetical protein
MAFLKDGEISVGVHQEKFMDTVQVWRGDMGQTQDIPTRVVWRDSRGTAYDALASELTISVTGNGSGAACLSSTITFESSAEGRTTAVEAVVAGEDVKFADVEILQTVIVTGDTDGCSPIFMLYMQDIDDAYKPIEGMKDILTGVVSEKGSTLTSSFGFDEHTGDLTMHFSNSDVAHTKDRFEDAGKILVNLRVYAMQPGSQTDGPLATLTDLPYGDFTVEILEQAEIDACVDNKLVKTDLTLADESRTRS